MDDIGIRVTFEKLRIYLDRFLVLFFIKEPVSFIQAVLQFFCEDQSFGFFQIDSDIWIFADLAHLDAYLFWVIPELLKINIPCSVPEPRRHPHSFCIRRHIKSCVSFHKNQFDFDSFQRIPRLIVNITEYPSFSFIDLREEEGNG